MGGLRKKLPFTFIAALIGGLALAGLPLTSGYLSKDGILIQAFDWSDGKAGILKLVPYAALLTSWFTAFYVARLIVKVFFGEFRLQIVNPHVHIHMGDGGWQYKLPLVFLALCCLFPVFSYSPVFYEDAWVFKAFMPVNHLVRENLYHVIIPVLVVVLSVVVIYGAYVLYVKRNSWSLPQKGIFYRLSFHEWYIDRFYNRVIVRLVMWFSNALYRFDKNIIDGFVNMLGSIGITLAGLITWFDKHIVDGLLHLIAGIVQVTGNFFRRFQSGKIQYYLFSMLLVLIAVFIFKLIFA